MGREGQDRRREKRKIFHFPSQRSFSGLFQTLHKFYGEEAHGEASLKKTDTCAKPFSLTPNLQKLEEHQFFNWNSRASDHKTIFLLGASWHAVVLSFCVFLIVKKHQWNLMAPVQTELVRRAQKHQGHRAGDNTHCDYLYTSKLVPV